MSLAKNVEKKAEIEDKLMSVEDKKVLPNKIAKFAVSQDINYVL